MEGRDRAGVNRLNQSTWPCLIVTRFGEVDGLGQRGSERPMPGDPKDPAPAAAEKPTLARSDAAPGIEIGWEDRPRPQGHSGCSASADAGPRTGEKAL
jgi:hypothetical protein